MYYIYVLQWKLYIPTRYASNRQEAQITLTRKSQVGMEVSMDVSTLYAYISIYGPETVWNSYRRLIVDLLVILVLLSLRPATYISRRTTWNLPPVRHFSVRQPTYNHNALVCQSLHPGTPTVTYFVQPTNHCIILLLSIMQIQ